MGGLFERLRRCRRGATAVEYAFIVALICIGIIALVSTIGGKTRALWTNTSNSFPTT